MPGHFPNSRINFDCTGKKRKAKESKKSNKKKKKRKNDSDSDAEFDPEPELEPPSSKGRKSKGGKTDQNDQNNEDMPTVSEVCENFGLTDVDLEYSDADYQNLTTYKLFQQTYRQRIQAANPKVKKILNYQSLNIGVNFLQIIDSNLLYKFIN